MHGLAVLPLMAVSPPSAKNVLFLVADDLRPDLNVPYGQSHMHTPMLDAFSKSALIFDRAYANMAICSPSRNSFMTGRMPDKTRVWNFLNDFRQGGLSSKGGTPGSQWVSLPQLFKQFGYTVLGHGKLYHHNTPPNYDQPHSWSQEQDFVRPTDTGCPAAGPYEDGDTGPLLFCPDYGKGGSTDKAAFSDYNTTMSAIDTLKKYAWAVSAENGHAKAKPFFIALGLHFPHLPWATPKWTVEKYPADKLAIAQHQNAPIGAPDMAFTAQLDGVAGLQLDESNPLLAVSSPKNASGKLVHFRCPSPHNNTVPKYMQRQLRQGYYSAVTHSDWLFGKILATLKDLEIQHKTLVVVTSDHGWQLGEHGEWGKHTLWESSLHIPLMIRAPWKAQTSAGRHTSSMTELIDLYRTIVSLAGLPSSAVADDVDGDDVSALLDEPDQRIKEGAYSQYSRCPGDRFWPKRMKGPDWYWNNCELVPADKITSMGYTVRTASWRFTEWYAWDGDNCVAMFDAILGFELYEHSHDPDVPVVYDKTENVNLANDPRFASTVTSMRRRLRKRFDTGAGLGCPPKPKPGGGANMWHQKEGKPHPHESNYSMMEPVVVAPAVSSPSTLQRLSMSASTRRQQQQWRIKPGSGALNAPV
jgi:iduronate 2-sulfatase